MPNWIEDTYPGYQDAVDRAEYAMDAYTGKARDKAMEAASVMKIGEPPLTSDPDAKLSVTTLNQDLGTYLRRRAQSEHVENYKERVAITRYPMHMQAIVAGFVGRLSEVEAAAVREYGVLGDPDDSDTAMGALWRDCDGRGTNWMTRMNEALTSLIVLHNVWYAVFPPNEAGQLPRFRLFDTARITNFREEDGRLLEVVIEDSQVRRSSLREKAEESKEFVHYEIDGWTRYAIDEGNQVEVEADTWSQQFVDRHGRPRIPIGRVGLALKYHVGYRVAQGNIDLYNLFSDARNLIRVANHPVLRGQDLTEQEWNISKAERAKGSNALMGNWDYIGPNPGNAQAGYDIYKEEVRDYYITSLQQYNDAPKVVTARQVEEDSKGEAAFLSIVTDASDEIENDALWLASQIVSPSTPSQWGDASVTRSKNYRPVDEEDLADRLTERFFGSEAVPSDPESLFEAAKAIHELLGIPVPADRDEALRQAVEVWSTRNRGTAGQLQNRRSEILSRLRGQAA